MLIPRSPSRLDRVEDWTYWKGDVVEQYPSAIDSRYVPERQTNPTADSCSRIIKSLNLDQSRLSDVSRRLELLETLATSYSLLEFHNIPSNCTSNSTSDGLDGDLDDEDDLWSSIRTPDRLNEKNSEGIEESPDAAASAEASDDSSSRAAGGRNNSGEKPKEKEKGPGKHPYIVNRCASCSHLAPAVTTHVCDPALTYLPSAYTSRV